MVELVLEFVSQLGFTLQILDLLRCFIEAVSQSSPSINKNICGSNEKK